MERYITAHHGIDKKTLEEYSFLAECEVENDDEGVSVSTYWDINTGLGVGDTWFREMDEKAAICFKTEDEKPRAIEQAQRMLDEYTSSRKEHLL